MQWTAQSSSWWFRTWCARLAMLALLGCAWGVYPAGGWRWTAGYLAAALVLFGLQRVTRQVALGWVIDPNGERQKVDAWVKGLPIYTPTTRAQRIADEAFVRDARRRNLLWLGLSGWGAAAAAFYLYPRYAQSAWFMIGLFVCGLAAIVLVPLWLTELMDELLYLSGWQYMKGAQVLDGEPQRPGLEDVKQQKAHGDGRVATEDEALGLLNPDR
jgi:hypothetical protein